MMTAPNPIAFSVNGFEVRWYGVLMATAVLFGMLIAYLRAEKNGIERERIIDFVLICIPISFIGARFYYVLFNYSDYEGNFYDMINVRAGGLAIHGGLIAGFLVTWILCKTWKCKFLNFLDLLAPSVAIGQAIGRWGNFFNSEAHGGPTNLPWAIMVNGEKVHPTFLYESIWCLLLFFILIIVAKEKKFDGQIILLYGMLYSFERFFVEYLRTDSLMLFGALKQAMVLSAFVFICCFIAYIIMSKRVYKQGTIFIGSPSRYKGKFKR